MLPNTSYNPNPRSSAGRSCAVALGRRPRWDSSLLGLSARFVEMEALCRSQNGGAAFCSIVELFFAEVALAVEKTLLSLLLAMGSSSSQTAPLVEGPDAIYRLLRKSKNEVVPENKDDGDSDEDEEDDDEQDGEDQEEDDGAEGDPSGDENAEGDENDNPEANGEGENGSEEDDDDDDDDEDDDDDDNGDDEEDEEEEDEEDELPQPPAKKRK